MTRIRVEIPGMEKLGRSIRTSQRTSGATGGYRASPEVARALQPTRAHSQKKHRLRPWLISTAFVGLIVFGAKFVGQSPWNAVEKRSITTFTPSNHTVEDVSRLGNPPTSNTPDVVHAAARLPPTVKCDMEVRAGLRQQVITYDSNGVTYAINGQARSRAVSRGWVDGKDRFEPQELLRLLGEGLKQCGRGSPDTVPIVEVGSATRLESTLRSQMSADSFTKAASDGDRKTIESYLRAGFDVNARDRGMPELDIKGGTAVEAAAASGQCEILDRLLAAGGNADPKEVRVGLTPLILAAQKGSPQCVKLLLDKGVRIDVRAGLGEGTALTMAAYQGHMEVVRLLVAAGASLTVRNKDGDTPYKAANAFGNHAVAAYLKAKGAR